MVEVAIIVPVYNQEQHLEKCLDSIINQTYKEFECILVDDGSTDSSPRICNNYAEKDSRFLVIHKENEGVSIARKIGFEHTNAKYICFLDSDDYMAPEFLDVMLHKIIKEDADVCNCGHYQFKDETIIENTYDYNDPIVFKNEMMDKYLLPIVGKIYKEGYVNYPGYIWGKIYKRSVISEECFVSERQVLPEDDIFHLYITPNLNKAVFIKDKLIYYRINDTSLTHSYRRNMWKRLKNRHQLVVNFFKHYPQNIHIRERVWASGFFSIYVALRNAYELDNYQQFKSEITEVLNDSMAKDILKSTPYNLLTLRQRLMHALLCKHMYYILYISKKLIFKG